MAHTEEPYWLQEKGVVASTPNPLAAGTNNNGNNGPVYRPNDNPKGKTEDTTGAGIEQVLYYT